MKRLHAEAGGKDRRKTDDGGHYIAVRFNGPRDAFNHFAQDASPRLLSSDRREAALKKRYGDKPVIYPPMPDDMRALGQPPGD